MGGQRRVTVGGEADAAGASPQDIPGEPVEAQVDVVELLGNEILLYLDLACRTFIARVDPRSDAHVGQRVQILVNIDRVHLFDAQTGAALR